jgi:YgiT-type zinc finger domain-containing protein
MKCLICKQGETRPDTTTVTLEVDESMMVFKHVPADVCEICGEAYVDEQMTTHLLTEARRAADLGVQVDVRDLGRSGAGRGPVA